MNKKLSNVVGSLKGKVQERASDVSKMVTAGLIAGVLSGCYPEQNKGEEVNTSSHEVSVVVEKQPKQSVEQDEEDVEGIPGLRRGEGGKLRYTNGSFTHEFDPLSPWSPWPEKEFIAAARDNAENGEKMAEMVRKGDVMGIFAQALTKPHAKQAVFQAMKRVIIDGDMYGRTDMEGAQQVYEQSVTGNTAKGFRSFYTRGLRSFYDPDYNNLSAQEFGNTKAQSVIFSHLHPRTKSATFTDFYTAFTLPDILRIVSELSPEERVFLKDAYTQYKNFYFANKAKIDALVQEQERLDHIYKDREEEMDTLWRRHAFSERYDSLEILISEETKKDQPDLNLLTQYMDEQNEIGEEAEREVMRKYNLPYYFISGGLSHTRSRYFYNQTAKMKGIQEFRAFLEQNGRTQFDHEEGINPAILKTSYRWFNDPVRVKLMDTIHAAL